MYASLSFQNIKMISASTFADLESVPFFIKFETTKENENGRAELCLHLGNAPLALALVTAINDVLKDFADRADQEASETLALANAHLDGYPPVQPFQASPNLDDKMPF